MNCRICHSEYQETLQVKELVLGYNDVFTFGVCSECQTIQIDEIPKDLDRYYPLSYYSLNKIESLGSFGKLKAYLLFKRDLHIYQVNKNLIGNIFSIFFPFHPGAMKIAHQFVLNALLKNKDAKIHDAGCGTGHFLNYYNALGFKNLSGSDPFIEKSISYGNFTVEKKELKAIDNTFDYICLNHVIEHVIDPKEYLEIVYAKLNQNGECLVRTPLAFSDGFNKYHENWVGLEAPRHLHIFSQKSFILLAESIGFKVVKIEFDAIGWHYQVSEAYAKNVPQSKMDKLQFTTNEMNLFEELAQKSNANNNGDTVAYFLKK